MPPSSSYVKPSRKKKLLVPVSLPAWWWMIDGSASRETIQFTYIAQHGTCNKKGISLCNYRHFQTPLPILAPFTFFFFALWQQPCPSLFMYVGCVPKCNAVNISSLYAHVTRVNLDRSFGFLCVCLDVGHFKKMLARQDCVKFRVERCPLVLCLP